MGLVLEVNEGEGVTLSCEGSSVRVEMQRLDKSRNWLCIERVDDDGRVRDRSYGVAPLLTFEVGEHTVHVSARIRKRGTSKSGRMTFDAPREVLILRDGVEQ